LSTRLSDGSLAHDAILTHQTGQLSRCDSVRGLIELEVDASVVMDVHPAR
jgi:hypothetical protein